MYGTRRRVELGGHLYIKIKTGEASNRITCNTKVWKKGMDSRHIDLRSAVVYYLPEQLLLNIIILLHIIFRCTYTHNHIQYLGL